MAKIYSDISVIIADDHPLYLKGLNDIITSLDICSVVGTATNGNELLQEYKLYKPDIIITDIKMPSLDGIDATQKIRELDNEVKIICLSVYEEKDLVVDMLRAGANGYLVKNADKDEIREAIIKVYEGGRYLCRKTLETVLAIPQFSLNKKMTLPNLSPKELEVIQFLCKQLSSKEIAREMSISHRTVEQHLAHIREKLNVDSSLGIAIYAIRHRLVKDDYLSLE